MVRTLGLVLALVGVWAAGVPPVEASAIPSTVVRRTSHGIPHILAGDYRSLGVGAGYAFAEDNLCVLADDIVTLSAERSRWFGPDAETVYGVGNLVSDFYHQQVNQSAVVERLLANGPSRQARDLMRGYADGYNRYLAEKGVANLPKACRGAEWVRPITELDLWRRAYQAARFTGGEDLQDSVVLAQPPGAPTVGDPRKVRLHRSEDQGSNAFGLGSKATVDRTSIVLGNPHLPWQGEMRLYQQQLTIPGELNVSGASLYGLPVVSIGHTNQLAWTHTASTAQTVTLNRLTLAHGDPTSYVVDGETRRMSQETVAVQVRQANGSLTTATRTSYSTPEGPLFVAPGLLDWSDTTAYALHDANADNLRMVDTWLAMGREQSIAGLRAAQQRYQGMAWVNTIASDTTGNTYFGTVQVVPHVTDELAARCTTGPQVGLVILDGSRSSCGWGSDPDAVTPGLFGPSRLPSLTRQDSVSNMNNSPWMVNPAAPLTGYPKIVGGIGTPLSPRSRLGLDMIADRLDGSDGLGMPGFTLSTLQATMFGNRNLIAEGERAAVVAMCQANPKVAASNGDLVDVSQACATLAGWDGRGNADSRGAFLWRKFMTLADRPQPGLWLVPFDPADPLHTPRGINTASPVVRAALADAVQAFAAHGVAVDVPLSTVQQYAGVPIHGCSGREGCFNAISQQDSVLQPGGDTRFGEVSAGSTFIMAVELTKSGPRARTILVYGQSADPASPWHTDQARLYAAKQWVTGRFTEPEILHDPNLTIRILH